MIDLYASIGNRRLDCLRNQVAALDNAIVQIERAQDKKDIPLLALLKIERMRRMDELSKKADEVRW